MDNQRVEQTLVLIKPDGLFRSLTGNIISMLSETKLKIVGAKMVSVSRELAESHYNKLKEEKGETIFEEVIKYIQGYYHTARVMALVYEGDDAVAKVREVAGSTNPEHAFPITIRGKYGRIHSKTNVYENVIHASANVEEAEREIKLWFQPDELTSMTFPTKKVKLNEEKTVWS